MRVLVTGGDLEECAELIRRLATRHELTLTGFGSSAAPGLERFSYTQADLREPEQVEPLIQGAEALVRLDVLPRAEAFTPPEEKELLDRAARGMFTLLHQSLKAGVARVVLASRLELVATYGPSCYVDETWQPQPGTDAASLAPFVAELTLREFVRAEDLLGICLRFGPLGDAPDGTTLADALPALDRALTFDLGETRYRWRLYQVCSTDRFPLGAAAQAPFSFSGPGAELTARTQRTPRALRRD
jgi:nucleoside-diphosphate-sugar epimerase